MLGLVGKKCGMTRIFTDAGESIPVTVIDVTPNRITQIKNLESDGYCALQITAGHKAASRLNKPMTGHFRKAEWKRVMWLANSEWMQENSKVKTLVMKSRLTYLN